MQGYNFELPLNKPFDDFEYEFFKYLGDNKIDIFRIPKKAKDDFIKYYYSKIVIEQKVKEIKLGNNSWFQYLKCVKKFFDDNNRRPKTYCDDNNEKKLAKWIYNQSNKFNNNNLNKEYCEEWNNFCNEYSEYMITDIPLQNWITKFNRLNEFIKSFNKLPSKDESTLYNWLQEQITSSFNSDYKINKMKEFIIEYEYLLNDRFPNILSSFLKKNNLHNSENISKK